MIKSKKHKTLFPIIDIEAMGGFGEHSYPIEVAYSLPDSNDIESILINPLYYGWDEIFIEDQLFNPALANFSLDELLQEGVRPEEACSILNKNLNGIMVHTENENTIKFDAMWLNHLYKHSGMNIEYSLKPLSIVVQQRFGEVGLSQYNEFIDEDFENNTHRAVDDIILLHEIYLKTAAEYYKRHQNDSGIIFNL